MNSAAPAQFSLPRWALLAIVGMLLTIMATVALVRQSGTPIREPDAATVAMRELRFEDRSDGSVAVIDHRSNRQIDAITGEAGFARGTLRGFARDRRVREIGPAEPLQLMGRADGRLTLFDPATGRIVDLESFGPTNAAVFARFLNKTGG